MLFAPKQILVPVALSNEEQLGLATHSVLTACDIAEKFSSNISLLYLTSMPAPVFNLDPSGHFYRAMADVLKNRLKNELDSINYLKHMIENRGLSAKARVVENLDDTADAIIAASLEAHADLLVLSSHGRLGLSGLLFGSVAGQVAKKSKIPVLILHPQGVKAK